jgi:hypothetical protein
LQQAQEVLTFSFHSFYCHLVRKYFRHKSTKRNFQFFANDYNNYVAVSPNFLTFQSWFSVDSGQVHRYAFLNAFDINKHCNIAHAINPFIRGLMQVK